LQGVNKRRYEQFGNRAGSQFIAREQALVKDAANVIQLTSQSVVLLCLLENQHVFRTHSMSKFLRQIRQYPSTFVDGPFVSPLQPESNCPSDLGQNLVSWNVDLAYMRRTNDQNRMPPDLERTPTSFKRAVHVQEVTLSQHGMAR